MTLDAITTLITEIDLRLRKYGQNRHGNVDNPLDELIFIILSDQTEQYSFVKTWAALKARFPIWEDLLDTTTDSIADVIREGGLQNKKARYIKGSLEKIKAVYGDLTLKPLENLGDEEILRFLKSLPGISAKNARCIMMYALERKVFPVDTHVWRICRRLGIAPAVPKPTAKQQEQLEARIPIDLRYSLHVNLVSHGREICVTYWPKCEQCILADICQSFGKADEAWGEWRKPRGVWERYTEKRYGT